MATARKKSGGTKASGKAKPVVKAAPKPKAKPARKKSSKPAPKAASAKTSAKASVKPVAKRVARSAAAKSAKRGKPTKPAKPVKPAKPAKPTKPAPKPAAKPAGKPVQKGPAPLNAGALRAKAIAEANKAAAAAAKAAAIEAAKPKPRVFGKLVPATKAALEKAAMPPEKTTKSGAKSRVVVRAAPEVRPLGVLPTESMAKPRFVAPTRPVAPVKPAARPAPKGNGAPKPAAPAKPGSDRLSEADYKHFEERLLRERERIMREMGHLENTVLKVNPKDGSSEMSGYSFHMADAGTDSMEREISFDLASKEGKLLREIDEALRRIYNGVYGICEVSGVTIARARLEALPWARYTVAEQEKLEKEQRAGRLPTKEE